MPPPDGLVTIRRMKFCVPVPHSTLQLVDGSKAVTSQSARDKERKRH